jgi:hypothetical protein
VPAVRARRTQASTAATPMATHQHCQVTSCPDPPLAGFETGAQPQHHNREDGGGMPRSQHPHHTSSGLVRMRHLHPPVGLRRITFRTFHTSHTFQTCAQRAKAAARCGHSQTTGSSARCARASAASRLPRPTQTFSPILFFSSSFFFFFYLSVYF